MFKHLAALFVLVGLLVTSSASFAATKKTKKKKTHKTYKVSKHKRKSRRYKRGTGPDLKSITTDSPYTEDSNNGVNPVETKQPGL